MSLETLMVWLIVGAITGILMDSILGGSGAGLAGSILVGIVGAITTGWFFYLLEIKFLAGLLSVILQAVLGAVLFLAFVRITRRT